MKKEVQQEIASHVHQIVRIVIQISIFVHCAASATDSLKMKMELHLENVEDAPKIATIAHSTTHDALFAEIEEDLLLTKMEFWRINAKDVTAAATRVNMIQVNAQTVIKALDLFSIQTMIIQEYVHLVQTTAKTVFTLLVAWHVNQDMD